MLVTRFNQMVSPGKYRSPNSSRPTGASVRQPTRSSLEVVSHYHPMLWLSHIISLVLRLCHTFSHAVSHNLLCDPTVLPTVVSHSTIPMLSVSHYSPSHAFQVGWQQSSSPPPAKAWNSSTRKVHSPHCLLYPLTLLTRHLVMCSGVLADGPRRSIRSA